MPADGIFLLPRGSQVDDVIGAINTVGGHFTVVYDEFCDITAHKNHSDIDWLWHGEFLADLGQYSGLRCLPLSEAGIYLLNASGVLDSVRLSMSKSALFCITKLEQDAFLRAAGVPQIGKIIVADREGIRPPNIGYPLVLKPNFGFASMFTKSVGKEEELIEHCDFYRSEVRNTQLHHFYSAYFESLKSERQFDVMVAERPYLDWNFYSVSYIVRDGAVHSIFPCRGLFNIAGKYTSFAWRAFSSIVEPTAAQLKIFSEIGRKLVPALELLDGVFSVEVLISDEAEDYRVLEMECRPMGSWMTRLVEYSFGINLDRVFIDCFLDRCPALDTSRKRAGLITRSASEAPVFAQLTRFAPLAIDRRESGGVMLLDCLYDHLALAALQTQEQGVET